MKRKLLSALLAAAMVVTAIPSAFAAKLPEEEIAAGSNIYTWGTFDSAAEVAMAKTYQSKNEFSEDGLDDGCIKTTITGNYGGLRIDAPFVAGETYDISFDVRTDDAATNMSLVFYYTGASYLTIARNSVSLGKDWTHFSFSWTNTGKDWEGTQTSGAGQLDFRYGDGLTKASYYVDNFSVVPHGKVDADYSSLKMVGNDKTGTTVKQDEEAQGAPVDVKEVAFSDMENHWAKDTVNTLATYGYIEGMGNNEYSPNTNVTRAQFVKMFVDATYDVIAPEYDGAFSDIKGDEWYVPYVTIANKLGMLDTALTAGKMFKPDQPITREEAASIAAKAAAAKNAEKAEDAIDFSDDADISVWAKAAVSDAAAYGLIKGYEDGAYKPKANITRAEAAQILKRVAEFSTRFEIYVDAQSGNDKNNGSKEAPLKTIYAARDMVRKYNKTMSNNIKVLIKGRHYLEKTFELTNEDSGMNGYRIIYTSWGEEKPELSMGTKFTGFQLHDASKNIYKIYIGMNVVTRHAYFNEVRGIRARTVTGLTNPQYIQEGSNSFYYIAENAEILNYQYPAEIEFVYHRNWMNHRAVVSDVADNGDGTVTINITEAYRDDFRGRFDTVNDHRRFPTYMENAMEFLDESSEWYMDSHTGYLYYIPREGEDMSTMEVTIPKGEKMIVASGNSSKKPIRNIAFDNIEFADTGWLRPTTVGAHFERQNNVLWDNGIDTPVDYAITVNNAHYIDFTNSKFTRMGSAALVYQTAIQHCNVIGNEFFDISGDAVSMGDCIIQRPNMTSTNPADFCIYNKVNNNYIHQIAVEYGSSAAISTGWIKHSEVNHNEIVNAPYSGMHIGWGWASYAETGTPMYDLELGYNYIHEVQTDRFYDGGAIYTIGASSLESENLKNRIVGNFFQNVRNPYAAVYPDEGSTHWHIYNNVTDLRDVGDWEYNFGDIAPIKKEDQYWLMMWTTSIKYNIVEENYSTTATVRDGTQGGSVVKDTYAYPDANWPAEAQAIIDNAGIEDEYIGNFKTITQPQAFIARQREYELKQGESVPLDIKIYGQYMEDYPLSDFDIDYWVSDPSVLEVSEDGVMTAKGTGVVWVVAQALVDGTVQTLEFKVWAGDHLATVGVNVTNLNMIEGYTAELKVSGETFFGREAVIPQEVIQFKSTDESVVTVDADGKVTAVGKGEATIEIRAEYEGLSLANDIPVKIITYTQEDSLDLPYKSAPSAMFSESNWRGTINAAGGKISVSGSPAYLTGRKLENELIAFDMSIENPNSWPSLTLCAPDQMKKYNESDCYMIGFKPTFIEFQRFNNGVRTMIFGDEQYSPVGGPGIPNPAEDPIFEYGKTYSVVVGALDTEEGTRIVLIINGEVIFDFLDTDENALPAKGLFGVYNPGTFTFSPYTGITNN